MYLLIVVAQLVMMEESHVEQRGSLQSSQLKIAFDALYRLTMNLMYRL